MSHIALQSNKYTIQNALFWGICKSHFQESGKQTSWNGRIVHLIIGIIETLPIVGQIVSLLELGIINFFMPSKSQFNVLPRAGTFFPQQDGSQILKNEEKIFCMWPYASSGLKLLGISETQKNYMDGHIKKAFMAEEIKWDGKKLSFRQNSNWVEVKLPISISICKVDAFFNIFLFPKTVLSSEDERVVKSAYNLSTGEFLFNKRIVGVFEEALVRELEKSRKNRGIDRSLLWRHSFDKVESPKKQMIEKISEPIELLFEKSNDFFEIDARTFSVRQSLILDLLEELSSLHQLVVGRDIKLPQSLNQLGSYGASHNGIKFQNISVFNDGKRWRAEIGEFGIEASHPAAWIISLGFTPPEYIKFYTKERPHGFDWPSGLESNAKLVKFNCKYTQSRDIWAMGLVVISILAKRCETINELRIAPLPSLKKLLASCCQSSSAQIFSSASLNQPSYLENGIINLTQEMLDRDIDALYREVSQKHHNHKTSIDILFEMVRQMLRIDPNERASVSSLLAMIKQDSSAERVA